MAGKQDQRQGAPASDRKIDLEVPKDQFGNEPDWDFDRYPDESPAKQRSTTPPSGQGGAKPHDGVSHQDMFPPNPPPSESAAAKGEENDRVARGETTHVELANERLAGITGTPAEDKTEAKKS